MVIPVLDADQDFDWGVWLSLSRDNFSRTLDLWTSPGREQVKGVQEIAELILHPQA